MADSLNDYNGVSNDDELPPTIHIEHVGGSASVNPQPHPENNQYGAASYHTLDRLDLNLILNQQFLYALRGGSDTGSDTQSIVSCPSSPTPSSSYHGSFAGSPDSQNLGNDFDRLSFDYVADGSPLIPYHSPLQPTHSPQEASQFLSGYRNDFGNYAPQDQLLSPNYQLNSPSSFYGHAQNPSSRSLPDLTSSGMQQEFTTNQFRRGSFSSMSSAGQIGPHTPDETINNYLPRFGPSFDNTFRDYAGVPSLIQSGPGGSGSVSPHSPSTHIHSIDMHPIHEFIKESKEAQAAPPDAEELRKLVADRSPNSRQLLQKHAKTSVSTPAGHAASSKRRKNPGRFFCDLKDCTATFTRKLGLDNHLKSHLGIMDQKCEFCQRSFSTSLGRHMKRCKQNPNRQEVPSTSTSMLKENK